MSAIQIIPGSIRQMGSGAPAAPPPQPAPVPQPASTPASNQAGSGIVPGSIRQLGAQPAAGNAPIVTGSKPQPQQPAAEPGAQDVMRWLQQQEPGKTEGLYRFIDTSQAPRGDLSDQQSQQWLAHAPVVYVPYSKALGLLGHPEFYHGLNSPDKVRDYDRFSDRLDQQIETAFSPMEPVAPAPDPFRHLILHPDERERLYKDFTHDPTLAGTRMRQNLIDANPSAQAAIGATREAARTAVGAHDIVASKPAPGEARSSIRKFAETPQQNMFQSFGGATETGAEFLGGEELLGAIAKVIGHAPTLAEAAKIEKEMQQGTTVGQLVKQALKQGTVAGGQEYVKSGGDLGAAAVAGGGTAAITAALGTVGKVAAGQIAAGTPEATRTIEGVEIPKPRAADLSEAQQKGAEAYGRTAGATIRPDLERINKAGEHPVMMNQPGGAPAVATGATVHAGPVPKIDVNATLNRTGDFARARQELADALNNATDSIDQATDGKFSKLQQEVSEARNAAYRAGTPEADRVYKQKLGQVNDLIAKTPGLKPEMREALTAGWRHFYVLEDVTRGLDKALAGLPGESAVSQTQRGIYGKPLLSELNRVIRTHGRGTVEEALGGAERVKALEEIGQATVTNAGRRSLNKAMLEVSKWIPTYVGYKLGHALTGSEAGAIGGAILGRSAGEIAPIAYQTVRDAVLSNPKVARNLLYAAQYGAKPENYGPFIANLIKTGLDQANTEEQEEPQQ